MVNHTISVLNTLVQDIPIGTNLALLHFLWMLVSGTLLPNRGGIFPALHSIGLADDAVRRSWVAFRKGVWQTSAILVLWRNYVTGLPDWQEHRYEGYRPVPADTTAFWRPTLKNCPSKHYHPAAGRALPAVIFGMVGDVGEINGQRLALPRDFVRVHPKDGSEEKLWYDILRGVKKSLEDDDILVLDAGVKIRQVLAAGIENFVLRLAVNFTANRNFLPAKKEMGRPAEYGALVRPLARKGKKGNIIKGTAPDETYEWVEDGRTLRAEIWRDLVFNEEKVSEENKTFDVYAIYDPKYKKPWLLASSVHLKPESVYAIYKDRWPIEEIPLSAKHMVGAHRQFVHSEESIQRLPELALLAGSVLSFLAATMPAVPTGFWDRKPKRTPGRFRRALIGKAFPKDAPISGQVRKKNSVTDHLPKGILGHRRKKSPSPA